MRETLSSEAASRPIGAHLPLGAGMLKAAERAGRIGATALQIFADNPTAWRRRAQPPAELTRFRERLAALGVRVLAIHGPYLVNLATPDELVWERSLATLTSELRVGSEYGATVVNVHIGSHRGAGEASGRQRIGEAVRRALEAVPDGPGAPRLALENSAGGGDGMGVTVEDLAGMLEAAARAGADTRRLCFCLDTAHLWGAGWDVADPDAIDGLLVRFDELLGADRLALVHLNDSKVGRGSHLDRHQHVGAGGIGPRGLRHLVRHPRLANVPIVIETPGMDEGYDLVNMERMRQLLATDDALPELSPEALTLNRSRSRTEPPSTALDPTGALNPA